MTYIYGKNERPSLLSFPDNSNHAHYKSLYIHVIMYMYTHSDTCDCVLLSYLLLGGFIDGRFLTGIRPQEYFFHCMAGREVII